MKNKIRNITGRWLLIYAVMFTSCKKESYLKDGGIENPSTSLSTYDYLKSNNQFDTAILLIDHFNLKDSLNKAATSFAFTDYAVKKLMTEQGIATLNDLYNSISSGLVTQYLFGEGITLDAATLDAAPRVSWAGGLVQCAVAKIVNTQFVYLTSSAPAFNYYTLQYVKINGVLDNLPNRPADDVDDVKITCQTSGIKTGTGTILHILANNAPLNKL